jgi:hypothetical protein
VVDGRQCVGRLVDAGQRQRRFKGDCAESVDSQAARQAVIAEGGEDHHAAWKAAHDIAKSSRIDHRWDDSVSVHIMAVNPPNPRPLPG